MNKVMVALGGNLGDPQTTFKKALLHLEDNLGRSLAVSTFIKTAPLVKPGIDPGTVPGYLNAAAMYQTKQTPTECLNILLDIERLLGRDRNQEISRWESRVIDLDLICVDQMVADTEFLTLPHPEMHKRLFVLEPMAEIWPDWIHPRFNKSVIELIVDLKQGSTS